MIERVGDVERSGSNRQATGILKLCRKRRTLIAARTGHAGAHCGRHRAGHEIQATQALATLFADVHAMTLDGNTRRAPYRGRRRWNAIGTETATTGPGDGRNGAGRQIDATDTVVARVGDVDTAVGDRHVTWERQTGARRWPVVTSERRRAVSSERRNDAGGQIYAADPMIAAVGDQAAGHRPPRP